MNFLGQGYQKLEPKQDRQTDTHKRDWTHYHVPLRSIRQHLNNDACVEDKREDFQNCSVLYCHMHTDMSSSDSWTVLGLDSYSDLLASKPGG